MLVFDKISMWGVSRWPIENQNLLFAQYALCDGTRLLSKLLIQNFGAKERLDPVEINTLLAYPEI